MTIEEPVRQKRTRGPSKATPARRAQLVEAALESFAEHGFERASLRDIAARAGVTHAAVLRHFGSKEELLLAALERRDEENNSVIAELKAREATRQEYLETIHGAEFDDPAQQRNWLALRIAATNPEHPAHEYFERSYNRTRSYFRDNVVEGEPAFGLTASDKATLMMMLMDGARIQSIQSGTHDAFRLVDIVLGLVEGPSDDEEAAP